MLRTSLVSSLVAVVLCFPAAAQAQSRWDAAGTVGLNAAHTPRDDRSRYGDDWFHVVQGALVVGRYLSPNLKLEIDASVTSEGRRYVERLVTVPGFPSPYPVGAEARVAVRSIGAAVTWQFRDNEWVHPFVRAGVSADFDRQSVRVWDQFIYPPDRGSFSPPTRVADQGVERPTTTTDARALLGAGAKLYVSPRTFFRTEGLAALGRSRQSLTLRVGFGVDF